MERISLREKWASILEEQAHSGLSKKAFCINEGLNAATFYYWQRRLREVEDEADSGFHAVQVNREHEVRLQLGGQEVMLSSCSVETLAGVIKCLLDA